MELLPSFSRRVLSLMGSDDVILLLFCCLKCFAQQSNNKKTTNGIKRTQKAAFITIFKKLSVLGAFLSSFAVFLIPFVIILFSHAEVRKNVIEGLLGSYLATGDFSEDVESFTE